MVLKRFTQNNQKASLPAISIWKGGKISFNKTISIKYNLTNYDFCILYFDNETRQIGIKLTNDKFENGTIKLLKRSNKSILFSAHAFCSINKIKISKVINHYKFDYDKENNMFLFYLDENKNDKKKENGSPVRR